MNSIDGAGLIPYIDNRDGRILYLKNTVLFLCLIKSNHKYDLPKGGLDKNESPLDCARREAFEEVNLKEENYKITNDEIYLCGKNKNLALFPCVLNEDSLDSLRIKMNNETKKYEHIDYLLTDLEDAETNVVKYMKDCFNWINDNFIS